MPWWMVLRRPKRYFKGRSPQDKPVILMRFVQTLGIYLASNASVEGEAPSGFAGGGGDASP